MAQQDEWPDPIELPSESELLRRFFSELTPPAAWALWRYSELLRIGTPEIRVQILTYVEFLERAQTAYEMDPELEEEA